MRAQVSAWGLVLATSQAPTKCMPTLTCQFGFTLTISKDKPKGIAKRTPWQIFSVEGGGFQMNLNPLILPNIFVTEYSYYTCVLGGVQM